MESKISQMVSLRIRYTIFYKWKICVTVNCQINKLRKFFLPKKAIKGFKLNNNYNKLMLILNYTAKQHYSNNKCKKIINFWNNYTKN